MFKILKKLRQFIAGTLVGATLFGGTAVFAANSSTIDVIFQPLKYYFDEVEKKPNSDQQGFVYKGTTYVPLRFISESLGKEVGWDGKNFSIYVGKQPGGKITYLGEMNFHTKSSSDSYWENLPNKNVSSFTTNTGERFVNGYYLGIGYSNNKTTLKRQILLNGNYKTFEAILAPSSVWNERSAKKDIGYITVYGDGVKLYESGGISSDIKAPTKVEVDVTGVLDLQIEMAGTEFGVLDAKFIQ